MTIYSFWIFDKHCNCIFNREWTLISNSNSGTINSKQNEEVAKLLYGMLYSMRSITHKMSQNAGNEIRSMSTGKYRVHTLFTATGLWFVLLTDFRQEAYGLILQQIYSNIYVKYVAQNWLVSLDLSANETETRGRGTRKINNRLFITAIEDFLAPIVAS